MALIFYLFKILFDYFFLFFLKNKFVITDHHYFLRSSDNYYQNVINLLELRRKYCKSVFTLNSQISNVKSFTVNIFFYTKSVDKLRYKFLCKSIFSLNPQATKYLNLNINLFLHCI